MGIYSIKKMAAVKAKGKEKGIGVGIRSSYLRVVGIQVDTEGAGKDPDDRVGCEKHIVRFGGSFYLLVSWLQAAAPPDPSLHRRKKS